MRDIKQFDAIALAHKGVRGLEPYQPGKPIEALERELGLKNIIKLASNENPLGPSPLAIKAIQSRLADLHYYPDAAGTELKAALAQAYGLLPEMITLGNGSENVAELIIRAFCEPEDEIIVSQYAFIAYQIIAKGLNLNVNQVPANAHGHDLAAMFDAINANTKIIFIVNPNNPTGTYLKQAELEAFLQKVPSHILVVIDEAYCEYMDLAPDYVSALSWIERYSNLIVTRTFSKAYGLAGLRIGFGASHPNVRDMLNRIRQPFNVNSLSLIAAEAALDDTAHLQNTMALNQRALGLLQHGLQDLGFAHIPSHANFVLVDMSEPAMPIFEALLQQGIIVRPLVPYGLKNYLRISTGTIEQINHFMEAFSEIMQNKERVNERVS